MQNLIGTHRCQTFVCAPRLAPLPLAIFVPAARLTSTSPTYVRTRCGTSLVRTAGTHFYILRVCHYYRWLHSYTLLVCRQHRRTPFVRIAEPRLYVPLAYIPTRCSSAFYIADLRSYVVQNLVGIHDCPTFVRAAHLPSTSPTFVRTHYRTSFVCAAVLHSYALLLRLLHR